jgi:hypothetical protein
MNEDAKRHALAALGVAVAAVVDLAFAELEDASKARAIGQQLLDRSAELLVTVKTPGMTVVGTLTSPTGEFPPTTIFRIQANLPEVGH